MNVSTRKKLKEKGRMEYGRKFEQMVTLWRSDKVLDVDYEW